MAKSPKRKRVTLTIKGNGRMRSKQGARRMLSPDRIMGITQDETGTVVRENVQQSDIEADESLDALIVQSGGELIKLSPIGFVDMPDQADHSRRGDKIAVNIDCLTIGSSSAQGTIIGVDGVERELVVRETQAQIEALINGD